MKKHAKLLNSSSLACLFDIFFSYKIILPLILKMDIKGIWEYICNFIACGYDFCKALYFVM